MLFHASKQALPITPEILLQIFNILDFTQPIHVAAWPAFLIAFYMFLRKSNVVPPSAPGFDPSKHLTVGDIQMVPTGLLITIKWSKTNQFGSQSLVVPISSFPGSPLCPLQAYQRLLSTFPATSSLPAFSYFHKHKLKTLTYSSFTTNLKTTLSKLNYPSTRYSGHSFRRGGLSACFGQNINSS